MNRFMRQFILWAVILLLVLYLFNVNLAAIITDVVHAAQTVHNSHH